MVAGQEDLEISIKYKFHKLSSGIVLFISELSEIYPELRRKEFSATRTQWVESSKRSLDHFSPEVNQIQTGKDKVRHHKDELGFKPEKMSHLMGFFFHFWA